MFIFIDYWNVLKENHFAPVMFTLLIFVLALCAYFTFYSDLVKEDHRTIFFWLFILPNTLFTSILVTVVFLSPALFYGIMTFIYGVIMILIFCIMSYIEKNGEKINKVKINLTRKIGSKKANRILDLNKIIEMSDRVMGYESSHEFWNCIEKFEKESGQRRYGMYDPIWDSKYIEFKSFYPNHDLRMEIAEDIYIYFPSFMQLSSAYEDLLDPEIRKKMAAIVKKVCKVKKQNIEDLVIFTQEMENKALNKTKSDLFSKQKEDLEYFDKKFSKTKEKNNL